MTGWRVYNGSAFIVDNLTTNDGTKALSAKQGKTLQDNKLEANKVGAANGVASLDANTKVPVAQLPNASTTAIGAVQLNNTLTSVSTTQALTAAQGKEIADAFTGTKSNSGYQKLYGGLIIQWGTATEHITQNFPIEFPNACLNVQVTPILTGGDSSGAVTGVTINSKNSFTCYIGSNTGNTAYYFAVGY